MAKRTSCSKATGGAAGGVDLSTPFKEAGKASSTISFSDLRFIWGVFLIDCFAKDLCKLGRVLWAVNPAPSEAFVAWREVLTPAALIDLHP
jgi:hypothetical protein